MPAPIFPLIWRRSLLASVVLTISACGGGGDGGNGNGTPEPPAGKFSGTLVNEQVAQGTVELLAANGVTRSAQTNAQGQFEFSLEGLEAPLLLRAQLPSGEVIYSASATLPASGNVLNIHPLTQLVTASLSPEGKPELLWALASAERSKRLTVEQENAASARVNTAVTPLASALKLPIGTDFTRQTFDGEAQGLGALLENLQVQTNALAGGSVFSMASARTPALPSVWRFDEQTIPPIAISALEPPVAFGPVQAGIENSYNSMREGARQVDFAKMDHAEIQRVMQEFQTAIADPDFSVERIFSIYKRLLLAMGFPSSLADEIVRQLQGSNPQEGFDLIASFFGPEGQKALDDMRNMQVSQVSFDPHSMTAIFQITIGGEPFFQTWSLSSGNALTGRTKQRDYARQCLRTRYDGPQNGSISADIFIDNSVYYNSCDFEINYATCIWQVGSTGVQNSGCNTPTTTGSAQPGGSTRQYNVRYGPLGHSRAFVACKAPAQPRFQGDSGPYAQQWQCVG
ncbi:MAG: hypothetical protein WBC18_20200 [Ottowia sp.]|uniref:hypothetical protein n=1 Tax=Ottowia sp. TaxID=1898956 RepID=UPI003C72AC94